MHYTHVLRHAKGKLAIGTAALTPVIVSVDKRLNETLKVAGKGSQHQLQLLYILSTVLDAIVDLKVFGLGRVALHEPLLKRLDLLKSHDKIRLAQAASYAREALDHLPNDET